MAIYHLSMKPISRSAGRSATAAAAYRAGCVIVDERTGEIHDYTRKGGVLSARLILPGGGATDRAAFWSRVEVHHKHPRAVTAREIVLALPRELSTEQRRDLAEQYGRDLADRYGVAVDVCIHAPDASEGEENPHAHVLMTACSCTPQGVLGKKVEALDPISSARAKRKENAVEAERPLWEALANAALERAGRVERIDHRTLEAQGIDRAPTVHQGPARTNMLRRIARQAAAEVERLQAELAGAVAERASAAAAAAAAVAAIAAVAPLAAAAEPARRVVVAPALVVPQARQAPQEARQAAQLAELRKAALQADAQRNAASMLSAQLGDLRGRLVELRKSLSDAQIERAALEQQISRRSWIERVAARLGDPDAERVAELRRQAQDIGRQIAETTALVPAADQAAEAARSAARAAKAAQAAVKAAEAALQAAQAQADRIARRQEQGERPPERPRPTG